MDIISDLPKQTCESTSAGWLWYCDVHDTHGNADFEEEAQLCAGAHEEFFAEEGDGCDVTIWYRMPPAMQSLN